MLAAYRFGFWPTLVTSLICGFLVGPIMPDHFTSSGPVSQVTSDWFSRSIDFVVLGQFLALLFRSLRRQRDAARGALYDPLTELPNRVLFEDRLDRSLAAADRSGGIVGVLFLDLDNFKDVNDSSGHRVGDELLVAISTRLQGAVRPGETLARLGGDEFAVIVEGTDPAGTNRAADRLLKALQAPFVTSGGASSVQVSIGMADTREGRVSAVELLHRADLAMYSAKRAGKNRLDVYRAELTVVC